MIIVIMFLLDYSYTKVYQTSAPRSKFQLLRNLKDKKVNYIFLGSSRVENGIVPELIKDKTGKTAVNLGFQASKTSDIYTVLKLLKTYNVKSDKILIQIDYIYNANGSSNIMAYQAMPFIKDNLVMKEYSDHVNPTEQYFYFFPFLRYCRNDLKIGLREIILNLAEKKTAAVAANGYCPLYGSSDDHNYKLPVSIVANNIYIDRIKKFAGKNNMNIAFFCAPFCKHTKNLDYIEKLKLKIPELKDYSSVIKTDTLFQNCAHLNNDGALKFTKIIIDELLK